MSQEIAAALVDIQASVIATSPHVSSPTKLRNVCDAFAKCLYRQTIAMQRNPEVREIFKHRFTVDPGAVS
jgi:hypothetical protein